MTMSVTVTNPHPFSCRSCGRASREIRCPARTCGRLCRRVRPLRPLPFLAQWAVRVVDPCRVRAGCRVDKAVAQADTETEARAEARRRNEQSVKRYGPGGPLYYVVERRRFDLKVRERDRGKALVNHEQ